MLSSSSGSLSLRERPSGLLLSAAGVATGSLEAPQSSAAVVAVAPQGSAEASVVPVPAQSVAGSTAGAAGSAPQSLFDSTAASTVAACSVLNSASPSVPPQP